MGRIKETGFDSLGRKVLETNCGLPGISTANMQTAYSYNVNSQLDQVKRNDQSREKYTYDVMNRLVRIDYYLKDEPTDQDGNTYLVYQYDKCGNVVSEQTFQTLSRSNEVTTLPNITEQAKVATKYEYDLMNRVTKVVQLVKVTGGSDRSGSTVQYTYDAAGRVTTVRHAIGDSARTVSYGYDTYGRPNTISVQKGSGTAVLVRRYQYSGMDLVSLTDYRSRDLKGCENRNVQTLYTRNSAGLLSRIEYKDSVYDPVLNLNIATSEAHEITYDARGYIVQETVGKKIAGSGGAGVPLSISGGIFILQYTYDAAGRLIETASMTTGIRNHPPR